MVGASRKRRALHLLEILMAQRTEVPTRHGRRNYSKQSQLQTDKRLSITKIRLYHSDAAACRAKGRITFFASVITVLLSSILLPDSAHAACTLAYSFNNGTTAGARQVNQNFTNLFNCPSLSGHFINPNNGTAGAIVIQDAPTDPDASIIQFTNNADNSQYAFIKGAKSSGIVLGGGTLLSTPTRHQLMHCMSTAPLVPALGSHFQTLGLRRTLARWRVV